MKRTAIFSALLGVSISAAANAAIATQWNFNSVTGDASVSTGTNTPNVGSGSITLLGGVTSTYATGSPDDPNTTDNSALNTTGFPTASSNNGAAGVLFTTSTVGLIGQLTISLDFRESATASRYFQLLVSSDGTNFTAPSGGTASFASAPSPNTATSFSSTGLYSDNAGSGSQQFVQGISYTFPSGSAYENDAAFAFKWVSVFDPANNTSYTGSNSTYAAGGTARFDEVTVSNSVPEPVGMSGFLLASAGLLGRRRRIVA